MVTWLSSAEGGEQLGVSRATLYAYVSRGLVRSSPAPGDSRGRRYAREDVERLRGRSEERRDPRKTAERALHFGVPVLESAITLISGDRLFYRGHDVALLARTRSLEEVASLIWTGAFDGDVAATDLHVVAGGRSLEGLPFITRAQSMLPLVATRDPLALDFRPRSVAQTGWRILNLLNGDPRAKVLFELLQTHLPKSAEVRLALEIAEAGKELIHDTPTIDFALVALARALKLPSGSALTLFAIGRSIGWIGHAIEQYGRGELIRPRAKHVGAIP